MQALEKQCILPFQIFLFLRGNVVLLLDKSLSQSTMTA